MNEDSEVHVHSDSESKEALEHLAKEKNVVSDSKTQKGNKLKGEGIKVRGSTRVVSKPSRINL